MCPKNALTPVKHQSIFSLSNERTEQEKRMEGMMEQLRCLQFLAQQGLAIRGHTDKESNFWQLVERAEKTPTLKSFMLSGKYASHETINELKQAMYRGSLNTLLTDAKSDVQHYAITVDKRQDCAGHKQLFVCTIGISWLCCPPRLHRNVWLSQYWRRINNPYDQRHAT